MRSPLAIAALVVLLGGAAGAQTVDSADLWRSFAEQVEVGALLKVRLQDGRRFTATLVQAQPGALLLQPRTRVPVPVQPVAYDEIVSLERLHGNGIGAGRAAAIGVASGAGAFLAILLILFASLGD